MRCYTGQHRFYAGVDVHARILYVHVLDHQGQTVFEHDFSAEPDAFLKAVKPFRSGLVVGAECMFAWYWLADLCQDQQIPFVLGHALAMRIIHGGKTKTDHIGATPLWVAVAFSAGKGARPRDAVWCCSARPRQTPSPEPSRCCVKSRRGPAEVA
jgi:hypothetical protein